MKTARFPVLLSLFALILFAGASCDKARGPEVLKLATTTSTENSGLLDVLLPVFEKKHRARVDVIAVGTGQALKLGENGDVDVVMVHAPDAEKKFVAAGFGLERTEIMYNDFVIVGSEDDPAGVAGMKDAAAALTAISEKEQLFMSRGDDSGTHKKERELWAAAGIAPAGNWYREVGNGMGATLIMASEQGGYTLTDRGTYLSMMDKLSIAPLVEGDPRLNNIYSVIAVNPERYPGIKIDLANEFIEWITSPEAREIISNYKIAGQQLFHPLHK